MLNILLRKIVVSVVLVLLSISLARAEEASPKIPVPQLPGVVQDIVARVNGKEITAAELKRAVDFLLANEPGAKLSPDALKKVNINVLESLISRELIYQAGKKLEIKDLEKQVREKLDQVKARFSSEADYTKDLSSKGLTEKELGDIFRNDIVINNFISTSFDDKISISEEECKKFYDQNIDKFTQPELVRVSHILIETNATMSAAEKKKAREKAEEIRKELLKGTGIVALARKHSDAPDSKLGGDLGYLAREQMPPSLSQAAFALKPGQVSEVVETKAGYDVLKMRDRRPSVTTPFDKVISQIKEYLKKQKSDAAVYKFLQGIRKSSNVEVLIN